MYRIAAFFRWDDVKTRQKMKQLGARYSKTHKCWHLPYNKENYNLLKKHFKNLTIEKASKTDIEETSNAQASAQKERSPRWIKIA